MVTTKAYQISLTIGVVVAVEWSQHLEIYGNL